jgi:hypothetical protein
VQSRFKRVNRLSQTLLELHAEHGLTMRHLIYLEHPSMMKRGQFWERVTEPGLTLSA